MENVLNFSKIFKKRAEKGCAPPKCRNFDPQAEISAEKSGEKYRVRRMQILVVGLLSDGTFLRDSPKKNVAPLRELISKKSDGFFFSYPSFLTGEIKIKIRRDVLDRVRGGGGL